MAIVRLIAEEKWYTVQVERERGSERIVAITQTFRPKTQENLNIALDVAKKYSKNISHGDGTESKILAGFEGGEMVELSTDADYLQVFLALG